MMLGLCIIPIKKYHKKFNFKNCLSIALILGFAFFVTFNFYKIPSIFIDEASLMYETHNMARFGVDSHLFTMPTYLQSYFGFGQSTLYMYLLIPFVKLFGTSVFVFRLPFIILTLFTIYAYYFGIFYLEKIGDYMSEGFAENMRLGLMLSMVTAPYYIQNTRWVLDCNIVVQISNLAVIAFFLGVRTGKFRFKLIGCLLFALTAWGYNVSWMWLLALASLLTIWAIHRKLVNVKQYIVLAVSSAVILLPQFIYALKSFIPSLNHTNHFWLMTIPKMIFNRAQASMVDLSDGNPVVTVLKNYLSGVYMMFVGGDKLYWNTTSQFGYYYIVGFVFLWIFFISFVIKDKTRLLVDKKYAESRYRVGVADLYKLFAIIFLSLLPVMLFVKPNANHWNLLHGPVLVSIGLGIAIVLDSKAISKVFTTTLVALAYVVSTTVFCVAYVGHLNIDRHTGYMNNMEKLDKSLDAAHKVHPKHIYFNFLNEYTSNVPYVLLHDEISPYEWQKTKNNPYSDEKGKIMTVDKFSNYRDWKLRKKDIQKGDVAFIPTQDFYTQQYDLQFTILYEKGEIGEEKVIVAVKN
jgi:hypothetical protein